MYINFSTPLSASDTCIHSQVTGCAYFPRSPMYRVAVSMLHLQDKLNALRCLLADVSYRLDESSDARADSVSSERSERHRFLRKRYPRSSPLRAYRSPCGHITINEYAAGTLT